MDGLGDLHRELSRWDQHEREHRPGLCPAQAVDREPLQDRQGEGGRLAGSRRCFGQQVASGEERRDCRFLHRGRLLVAKAGEGLEECRRQPERREGGGGRLGGNAGRRLGVGSGLGTGCGICVRHGGSVLRGGRVARSGSHWRLR